jgi:hypothetical protein
MHVVRSPVVLISDQNLKSTPFMLKQVQHDEREVAFPLTRLSKALPVALTRLSKHLPVTLNPYPPP